MRHNDNLSDNPSYYHKHHRNYTRGQAIEGAREESSKRRGEYTRPPRVYLHRSRGSLRSRGSSSRYTVPLQEKVKNCFRLTIAFIFSNVGVCGLFVGYTIMGSFLFQAIEKDENAFKEISVEAERNRTIGFLWNITDTHNVMNFPNWNSSTSVEIQKYQRYIIDAVTRGYDGNDNAESYDPWSFEGGFLYSLSVITTIGYGHISPKTKNGKVMTIIYAIFGMPVFLLYMANMGDILAKSLKWTYTKVFICRQPQGNQPTVVWRSATTIMGSVNPRNPQMLRRSSDEDRIPYTERKTFTGRREEYLVDMEDEVSIGSPGSWRSEETAKTDLNAVSIPITISLVILFALLYGGTELFQSFESWDPLTSFYFCFISLTTIGFGDVVPGSSSEKRVNFIYCSLYLMFGLALLSMCFNLMQEEVVHKFTLCIKSLNVFKKKQPES